MRRAEGGCTGVLENVKSEVNQELQTCNLANTP